MKYHLTTDNVKTVCGKLLANRPDVFVYTERGFNAHYAKEKQCKVCKKVSEKIPTH